MMDASNAAEASALRQLQLGLIAKFRTEDSVDRRTLRGAFVAALIADYPEIEESGVRSKLSTVGVRIRGAKITGDIQLGDFVGFDERGLPPVSLEMCHIDGQLSINDARLSRLSLVGSRLRAVIGRGVEIFGRCDLRHIAPSQQFLSIEFIGADIGGDLLLTGCELVAASDRQEVLSLRAASIHGSLIATKVRAKDTRFGGIVVLDQATIGERCELRGARFGRARDETSLSANGVSIKGDFQAEGATFIGPVYMQNCRVERDVVFSRAAIDVQEGAQRSALDISQSALGSLKLDECVVSGGRVAAVSIEVSNSVWADSLKISGVAGDALLLSGSRIGNDLFLSRATLTGNLVLTAVSMGGSLRLRGTTILSAEGQAIRGFGLRVNGSVELRNGFTSSGELNFSNCFVAGNFALEGANLNNPQQNVLSMVGAEIRGNLSLRKSGNRTDTLDERAFVAIGRINLANILVGGQLDIYNADIALWADEISLETGKNGPPPAANAFALDLQSSHVTGRVRIARSRIKGTINLSNATIRGSLIFEEKCVISGSKWIAVSAENIEIEGDLHLLESKFHGDLRFDRAQIHKETKWGALQVGITPNWPAKRPAAVRFPNAALGVVLNIEKLTSFGDEGLVIDLTGARVVSLADEIETAWGNNKTLIQIDGFKYDQIGGSRDASAAIDAYARTRWLSKQFTKLPANTVRFTPHSYTQLAKVLFSMGADDDARKILLARARTGRRRMAWPSRAFSFLYDWCFGYGLVGARASVTILSYWVLGAIAYEQAHRTGYLGASLANAEAAAKCNSYFNSGLHALDAFLPVLDINVQENCSFEFNQKPNLAINTPEIPIRIEHVLNLLVPSASFELPISAAWQWFSSIYSVVGWVLISLAVLTYSGLVRRTNSAFSQSS